LIATNGDIFWATFSQTHLVTLLVMPLCSSTKTVASLGRELEGLELQPGVIGFNNIKCSNVISCPTNFWESLIVSENSNYYLYAFAYVKDV
jgi:hypothetical protein